MSRSLFQVLFPQPVDEADMDKLSIDELFEIQIPNQSLFARLRRKYIGLTNDEVSELLAYYA